MGAMDTRNIYSNLAVNKYLHTVASCWISSTYNYGARNYKYKIYATTYWKMKCAYNYWAFLSNFWNTFNEYNFGN